jgi:hypothetical protein
MDKIFYLLLILVCIGNVAYIYLKGMDNRKMFYFIMGEMTLFLSAIVYNNVYGIKAFGNMIFIFILVIGLSVMSLCYEME